LLRREGVMIRERALKVVLVLAGLLFTAAVYPAVFMHLDDQALRMMLSVYATLGIFLLLAARNPSEHRSLIAFTAWSCFVYASVMAGQGFYHPISRPGGGGGVFFFIVSAMLLVL